MEIVGGYGEIEGVHTGVFEVVEGEVLEVYIFVQGS